MTIGAHYMEFFLSVWTGLIFMAIQLCSVSYLFKLGLCLISTCGIYQSIDGHISLQCISKGICILQVQFWCLSIRLAVQQVWSIPFWVHIQSVDRTRLSRV